MNGGNERPKFDLPRRFQNDEGHVVDPMDVAMLSITEDAEVVPTERGVVIDGALYRHVDGDD
jgi:hypothetical protein